METIMSTQRAYNQGQADSARKVLDAVIHHLDKLDDSKTGTQYRNAVRAIKKLKMSALSMLFTYICFKAWGWA